MSTKSYERFFEIVTNLLRRVVSEERENIERGSDLVVDAVLSDGFVYVFGTGHSMLIVMHKRNK